MAPCTPGMRQRRARRFLLAALGSQVQPLFCSHSWRLVCNSTTQQEWHVCDVGFFTDRHCTQAPAQQLQGFIFTGNASVVRTGGSADRAFTEFESSCQRCEAGEALIGVEFEHPAVVRCVRFSECPSTVSSSGRALRQAQPQFLSPLPATAAKAASSPTALPGILSIEGRNADLPPRRLGAAAACHTIDLERSAGDDQWIIVGEWHNPKAGEILSLDSSVYPLAADSPQVLGWEPPPQACGSCGNNGLWPMQSLQVRFSKRIFPGEGFVLFERGTLGDLSINTSDTAWFQFSDNVITIAPKRDLGASAACGKLRFQRCAVVDADGNCFDDLVGYSFCVSDLDPPVLMTTEPQQGGTASDLQPHVQFAFNEGVLVPPSAPTATFKAEGSIEEGISIDLSSGQVQIFTWNQMTGATEITIAVETELLPETQYQLHIPTGAVKDLAGNAWQGGTLRFFTPCDPAVCARAAQGPSAALTPEAAEHNSRPVPLYLVAVFLALSFGTAAFYGCRWCCNRWQQRVLRFHEERAKHNWNRWQHQPEEKDDDEDDDDEILRDRIFSFHKTHSQDSECSKEATSQEPTSTWQPPGQPDMDEDNIDNIDRASSRQSTADTGSCRPTSSISGSSRPRTAETGSWRSTSTEFGSDDGEWIKMVDHRWMNGRMFWQHSKTHQRRWDPPPRPEAPFLAGTQRPTSSPPRVKAQRPPSSPPTLRVEATSLESEEQVAAVKHINTELCRTMKKDLATRKKLFKALCLKWHPDKHIDKNDLATRVFQYLQLQKEWYLED